MKIKAITLNFVLLSIFLFFFCCDNLSDQKTKKQQKNAVNEGSQRASNSSKRNPEENTVKHFESFQIEILLIRAEALKREAVRRTEFRSGDRSKFPICYYPVLEGGGFNVGFRQGTLIGKSMLFPGRVAALLAQYRSVAGKSADIVKITNIEEDSIFVKLKELVASFRSNNMQIREIGEAALLFEEAGALTFYIQDEMENSNYSKTKLKEIHNVATEYYNDALTLGIDAEFTPAWQQEKLKECLTNCADRLNKQ